VDLNTNAFRIVNSLTTEKIEDKRLSASSKGGKAGGLARSKSLSDERKREIALAGSKARWARKTK
jgi:hypothetical protein